MWAVSAKGLHSGDGPFPEDAVLIDEEMFCYLHENYGVLNVEVRAGVLHISVDLVAYKQVAISRIQLSDWTMHNGIKVFDYELAQVIQMESRYG